MKYMLMIFGKQSDYDAMGGDGTHGPAWTDKDTAAMFAFMRSVNEDLTASGEMVDGQGLSEPSQARLVTAKDDGVPVISDGSYGETKEVLAGYWVLDCESIERATEIAARVYGCPQPEGAPNYPVVVRPIPDGAGIEM
ncbi:YciI family protein [Streptomyces sp. H27-D2]|uniref:YciI family protein n=1 Tax=Streptomyces sp. H27-D2 TaxID=3046304 RepID=UPI002DBB9185|nr:YciI family protein [Streptomyces sp. H27-D2]MEC4020721.1 YciI family protein [Streptomyces sp. H27-D2]